MLKMSRKLEYFVVEHQTISLVLIYSVLVICSNPSLSIGPRKTALLLYGSFVYQHLSIYLPTYKAINCTSPHIESHISLISRWLFTWIIECRVNRTAHYQHPKCLIQKEWALELLLPDHWGSVHQQVLCQASSSACGAMLMQSYLIQQKECLMYHPLIPNVISWWGRAKTGHEIFWGLYTTRQ